MHPIEAAVSFLRQEAQPCDAAPLVVRVRATMLGTAADALDAWKAEMLAGIDAIIQGYDPERHAHAIGAADEMLDRAREARAKLIGEPA